MTLEQLGVVDDDIPISDAERRRRERLWPCPARDFCVTGWLPTFINVERLLYKVLIPLLIVLGRFVFYKTHYKSGGVGVSGTSGTVFSVVT